MLLLLVGALFLSGCEDEETEKPLTGPERIAAMEQSLKGCWTCTLFEYTEAAAVNVAMSAIPGVAGGGISLLAVAYGLWMAIYIMKHVASLKEPDVGEFWKTMATQAFWVAMGAALLLDLKSGGKWSAVNAFAQPVYNGFVNAGLAISSTVGGPGPGSGMTSIVDSIQSQLNFGAAMGAVAFLSWTVLAPMMPLIGFIVLVTSVILMLWIPALLLGCTFRYGIALFMLPLAVGAYVFKPTRPFTGKVAKMYVEIGFAIMGMCAYAACSVSILKAYIANYCPFLAKMAGLRDDTLAMDEMLTGGPVFGLLFLAFFLVLYAEVALELFSQFAQGMGGIGAVGSGIKNFGKNTAKAANMVRKFAVLRRQRSLDKKAAKDYAKYKDAKGGMGKQKAIKAKERLMRRGYLDKNGKTTKDFAKLARGNKELLNFRNADLKNQNAARNRLLSMRNAALDKSTARLGDRNAAAQRLSGSLKNKMANAKGPFKAVKKAYYGAKLMALKAKTVSNKLSMAKNKLSQVGNNIKQVGNNLKTKANLLGNRIQNTAVGRAVGGAAKYAHGVSEDLKAAKNSGVMAPETRGPAQGVSKERLEHMHDKSAEATGAMIARQMGRNPLDRMKRNIQRAPGRALKSVGLKNVANKLSAKHGGGS